MKKRMNIVMVALLTILASCSTNYQMVTRVHKDGTVEKEVWALADSAFLAGDSNHNPFLFRLGFMHRDGLLWRNRKTES